MKGKIVTGSEKSLITWIAILILFVYGFFGLLIGFGFLDPIPGPIDNGVALLASAYLFNKEKKRKR